MRSFQVAEMTLTKVQTLNTAFIEAVSATPFRFWYVINAIAVKYFHSWSQENDAVLTQVYLRIGFT